MKLSSIAWIPMLVLAATAILKLADLREFDHALSTWSLLPEMVRKSLVIIVPAVELGISLAFVIGLDRRFAAWGAVMFLLGSAALYAAHLAAGQRPNCGCAGVLQEFQWARSEGRWLLYRNLILALLCVPSLLRSQTARSPSSPVTKPQHAGFTLVELLIVIAVIGVLVGLSLPLMGRIKESARQTKMLSYLSSHAANVGVYAAQHRDNFPYYLKPTEQASMVLPGCDVELRCGYFFGAYYWHTTMADLYADGKVSLSPPGHSAPDCMSWFTISATLRSRPEFWTPETRTGPEQWLAVRTDEVSFPAQKVMFRNASLTDDEEAAGLEFLSLCDGHAAKTKRENVEQGYSGGEGAWSGSWFQIPKPGMHTRKGARGRDLLSVR